MGQSTNAILAFGFDMGEELPNSLKIAMEEDDDFEWDMFLANDFGLILPDINEYKDRRQWFRDTEAMFETIPVEVIEHCSDEYKMYFLSVRGTKQIALRGSPRKINTSCYGNGELMRGFRDFCTRHDIPWQEPKWCIFSMWC